jgi:hypothetical protein
VSRRREAPLRYEWERIVLADPDMPPMAKFVALALATYGDLDGRDVRPGNDRLVADTGTSRATVWRALAYLRDAKLIESAGPANRRRGRAEEYHLRIPADHLDRCRSRGPDGVVRGGSGLTQRPKGAADQGSHRALIGADQGSQGNRSGLTQKQSGLTGKQIRAHTEPPPDHDQSSDHPMTNHSGWVEYVPNDRARPNGGPP